MFINFQPKCSLNHLRRPFNASAGGGVMPEVASESPATSEPYCFV